MPSKILLWIFKYVSCLISTSSIWLLLCSLDKMKIHKPLFDLSLSTDALINSPLVKRSANRQKCTVSQIYLCILILWIAVLLWAIPLKHGFIGTNSEAILHFFF